MVPVLISAPKSLRVSCESSSPISKSVSRLTRSWVSVSVLIILLDVIILVIRIKNVFLKEPPPEWGKSKGKRESLRSLTKDKKGGSLAEYRDGFDCVDAEIFKHIVHLNTEGS